MTNNSFPNGYALIIGIGRDLPDTVNDANALNEILIDTEKAGYPTEQVQLVTEKNATKQGIVEALKKLANQTKDNPNATVLIYYSGHGGQDLDIEGAKYYFIPNDYDDNNADTWLMKEDFSSLVKNINAQKMMLIFDCCHANGMKAIGRINDLYPTDKPFREGLDIGRGQIIIASCQENEKSYSDTRVGYGFFTRCLIEALEGENSSKDAAYVTYQRLTEYLSREVESRVRERHGKPQTPIINAKDATVFNICRNSRFKPPSPKVFIISDPKDTIYLKKLKDALNVLVISGQIEQWDIEDIPPFAIIEAALEQKLEKAQFVLGLMSTNFLNSPLCLQLHKKAVLQNKPFTPILLKPCGMKYLKQFEKYINPIPRKNGVSLPLHNWGIEEDDAYLQITDAIFDMTQPKELDI